MRGQDTAIAVDWTDRLDDAFATRYHAMYGHRPEGKPIEVESIRVVASSRPSGEADPGPVPAARPAVAQSESRARFGGEWVPVATYERADLQPGAELGGPALVLDARSAYVIEPGWQARVDAAGAMIVERLGTQDHRQAARPEVVEQELFTNRFLSIARQMGRMLQRTALSTNVKERLDFSCAVLDGDGELIAHAPHMPVHLGALGLCVRAVREVIPMNPGDVVATNHPAYGGSHIPDLTIITPVHDRDTLIAYVASRAHHAEIGGTCPGSMPPLARTLAEEGVVIEPFCLVAAGEPQYERLEQMLREAAYPSRAIADNLADVQAAVAANRHGAEALETLAREYGPAVVAAQMGAIKDRAERLTRAALARLSEGLHEAEQRLDDGSPIRVRIDLDGGRAVIDFGGSASRHRGTLNATPAVVRSAVLYVHRLLIGEDLPLN